MIKNRGGGGALSVWRCAAVAVWRCAYAVVWRCATVAWRCAAEGSARVAACHGESDIERAVVARGSWRWRRVRSRGAGLEGARQKRRSVPRSNPARAPRDARRTRGVLSSVVRRDMLARSRARARLRRETNRALACRRFVRLLATLTVSTPVARSFLAVGRSRRRRRSHPAFALALDQSLQSIDPRISQPYWDFMIDHSLGHDWAHAPIYKPDWCVTSVSRCHASLSRSRRARLETGAAPRLRDSHESLSAPPSPPDLQLGRTAPNIQGLARSIMTPTTAIASAAASATCRPSMTRRASSTRKRPTTRESIVVVVRSSVVSLAIVATGRRGGSFSPSAGGRRRSTLDLRRGGPALGGGVSWMLAPTRPHKRCARCPPTRESGLRARRASS